MIKTLFYADRIYWTIPAVTSVNRWTVLKELSLLLKISVTPCDYLNQQVQNNYA